MILDTIVEGVKEDLNRVKNKRPLSILKAEVAKLDIAQEPSFSFETALKEGNINFICEIKRASPSKGIIAKEFPYLEIAKNYEKAGASAIFVLTETRYFKSSIDYLAQRIKIPVLYKGFVIDEYQIYEGKLNGAQGILLICAILTKEEIHNFIKLADS